MTIVQLGVVVIAICLSTQVVSQNNTDTTGGNSTSNSNATTTMATDTYSSSANSTASPTGAGVSLHAGTFSFLIPVTVAASLLQRYC